MVSRFRQSLVILAAALATAICGLPGISFAQPPYYGPEFTFTNRAIELAQPDRSTPENPESLKKRAEFIELMKSRCAKRGDCTVREGTITYQDGWWFEVTTDPAVIEVKARRMTLEDAKRLKGRIQEDIFDAAESLGIRPNPAHGGGHIHIDAQTALEGNVKRMRNLIVDFANHPELASGVLAENFENAPPLAMLSYQKRVAFQKIVDEVDQGRITKIQELVDRIQRDVYSVDMHNGRKYQAVSLKRVSPDFDPQDQTVEIRSIRAQRNADDFVHQIQLLEGRMNWLWKQNSPIPFRNPAMPDTTTEMIQAYREYVQEAGLPWDPYREMLPKTWHSHPLLMPAGEGCAAAQFNSYLR